jgi:hypothetical protein
MKILIAGANGFVGGALTDSLRKSGFDVRRLIRSTPAGPKDFQWDPKSAKLEPSVLEGLDAVINLAGENIASGRWNAQKKARIISSRVNSTRLIVDTIAQCQQKPKVLLNASAIGYYSTNSSELLDEESPSGSGFLASVCRQWEEEACRVSAHGVREVRLRFGMVLGTKGGALKNMLLPFKLGLGGPLGSGNQFVSWVSLYELIRIVSFCLENQQISGPVNVVSPSPVTSREFAQTLGKVLGRPAILPAPAFVLKLIFGQMASELLLADQRCKPVVLNQSGYAPEHSDLGSALKHCLGR